MCVPGLVICKATVLPLMGKLWLIYPWWWIWPRDQNLDELVTSINELFIALVNYEKKSPDSKSLNSQDAFLIIKTKISCNFELSPICSKH